MVKTIEGQFPSELEAFTEQYMATYKEYMSHVIRLKYLRDVMAAGVLTPELVDDFAEDYEREAALAYTAKGLFDSSAAALTAKGVEVDEAITAQTLKELQVELADDINFLDRPYFDLLRERQGANNAKA